MCSHLTPRVFHSVRQMAPDLVTGLKLRSDRHKYSCQELELEDLK